ncbi:MULTISPECIES: ribose-5-phosphate isomerase RpiA [Asticcacaulis]|uniref:ribose-5-phosphate isomerase RpiA n=1 Tax=Asticcacaulis TaxID=76890 RepID=UPI001AE47162|nr:MULTISPECIES: ribose-5-phosphate isomerase RpiA [Asticcacaulis]MBP2158615.1 ribose 5-phosphate isomerase A [Asticcacaulis solisilvae]MDR6799661.1 ribose 5-phosphate isomerase A [Asticcacaulis sp. BE141]
MTADEQKEAVGEAALQYVKDGMKVGLGTGSTAAYFVKAIAREVKAGKKLTLVSTSVQTTQLAQSLGLTILDINDVGTLDVCVDGADEIGEGLALIKGGGGALLREKLIWEQAKTCVVIADAGKHVATLGKFPLPVEVEPFAYKGTVNRIGDVLQEFDIAMMPVMRKRDGKPFLTDGGNLIFDIACGRVEEPAALANALKSLTGVVDHGFFLDLAEVALLGTENGVKTIYP